MKLRRVKPGRVNSGRVRRKAIRIMTGAAALAAAGLAGTFSLAQQNSSSEAPVAAPADIGAAPSPPVVAPPPQTAPPPPSPPPVVDKAPPPTDNTVDEDAPEPLNVAAAPPKIPDASPQPRPVRGPIAVLQALDKVTAETIRFQVPVPGRVRYKALVIEVKVCETRGAGDPLPKPSAFLEVTSDPRNIGRTDLVTRKQVFKGWMFANAPGVHALQHPTYDLWLIACGAAAAPQGK